MAKPNCAPGTKKGKDAMPKGMMKPAPKPKGGKK